MFRSSLDSTAPLLQLLRKMSLATVKLRDFLADPNAPDGETYLWNDTPFAQLQLFEREYTLLWLGSSDPIKLGRAFIAAADAANYRLMARQRLAFGIKREWAARIAFLERDVDKLFERRFPEQLPDEQLVKAMASFYDSNTGSVLTRYIWGNLDRYQIELWADAPILGSDDRDVGFSANLPLWEPPLNFLRNTAELADEIPDPVLRDLFANTINLRVSRLFT